MTEAEWWAEINPIFLVEWLFAQRSPSDRKQRLFAHACSTRLWRIIPDWPQAKYLGIGEQFIEGKIDRFTIRNHLDPIDAYRMGFRELGEHMFFSELPPPRHSAASGLLSMCWAERATDPRQHAEYTQCIRELLFSASITAESIHDAMSRGQEAIDVLSLPPYAAVLHDIFGPLPFRDVVIAPEWFTSDVTALARGIYDEKAFDRMPILSDALQDAGCDNDEILNHCRDEKCEHVRGCWVVDLLLGKPWREGA